MIDKQYNPSQLKPPPTHVRMYVLCHNVKIGRRLMIILQGHVLKYVAMLVRTYVCTYVHNIPYFCEDCSIRTDIFSRRRNHFYYIVSWQVIF